MAKNVAYVVWVGRSTGIFTSWAECEKQVKGFPGAKFKGFPALALAEHAATMTHDEYQEMIERHKSEADQDPVEHPTVTMEQEPEQAVEQGLYPADPVHTTDDGPPW